MSTTVTVIDYGLGNLHSVINALHHVGADVTIAEDASHIHHAQRLILPGVGAFADGMKGLAQRGQIAAIHAAVARRVPLIGICLGMQLLFDESDEFGLHAGLGLIPGRVERIPQEGVKVPHVGWNRLLPVHTWADTPLAKVAAGEWAYFVHSFRALPTNTKHVLANCHYGPHHIAAVVTRETVCGFQFHPEKSGAAGLSMLAHFCGLSAPDCRPIATATPILKDAPCTH